MPITSCPVTGECWKECSFIFFYLSLSDFYTHDEVPPCLLFSRLSTPSSLNLSLTWEMVQFLNHLRGPLLDFSPVCPITSCMRESSTRPSTPDVSYQGWVEGKDPHFDLLAIFNSPGGCWPHLPEGYVAGSWPACCSAGPFFSKLFYFQAFHVLVI